MTTLVLVTGSYPYDQASEQTFLDPEIEYLASFDRAIIVPQFAGGTKQAVPAGVKVEESYIAIRRASFKEPGVLARVLVSRLFYQDLLARPSILFEPLALKRLALCISGAERARRWVVDFIEREKLHTSPCVFYTYWLGEASLGIGLTKKRYPQIKLVSRAHGADLYEERYEPAYLPCRRALSRVLDRLFLISDDGRDYIRQRYPGFALLSETARLGVRDPGFVTSCSADGVFRIASCSFMVPIKRLDLLLKGIDYAARARPEQQFEWHHIGDGPLQDTIEETAQRILPANVRSSFMGYLPNTQVMLFYRNNPLDLFMNVSESEGIPVSVMEAISCGLPIVATAVGGTPEIVSERNGKLLNPNPTPAQIAMAITSILDHPERAAEKRRGSKKVWQERFDASHNFQTFAGRLKSLAQES